MTKRRFFWLYVLLIAGVLALFCVGLIRGSVRIPLADVLRIIFADYNGRDAWRIIVLETRLPQTVTALLAGAALSVSGLMLQTLFKNPLAGPSILGISDGANLGVAIAMIWLGAASYLSTIVAALIGAAVVLLLLLWFSHRVSGNVMLLIIGIMLGYLASSVISILNYQASADKVHQYVMWGMGDFSGVSLAKLPWLSGFVVAGLFVSMLLVKPLNALLLGESYAANLGVNVRRTRVLILICSGVLTAVVTAFCGPISFIGLAVPHIARLLTGTDNHRYLLPVTLLTGSCIALLCSILTVWPGSNSLLPLSAITPIVGVPVILYVIVNRRNQHYFN